jgi:two-component system KDP operon response regulator KdpE
VTRVLVVDDDPSIVRALAINLRARRYEVSTAASGTDALRVAEAQPPDLVVLDLGLPDLEGVEVLAGLRRWTQVPVIVLSGRSDSLDKVQALDAGADDYVTKPFGMDELLARMRAVSRRVVPADDEPVVTFGRVRVDLGAKRVQRRTDDGIEDVHLTPTEWDVLDVLLRHPGKLVSQRQLLVQVWGPAYARESGYTRLYLAQLRRKLEDDPRHPRHLLTEPGMGYRFRPEVPGSETPAAASSGAGS